MKKRNSRYSKKSVTILITLALVLAIAVGATVAYIFMSTRSVENKFEPASVTTYVSEETANGEKTEVKIQNTGNVDAYIRAAVVITWQDSEGNVYGQMPVAGTDYEINYDLSNGWKQGNDTFYYWTSPVAKDDYTGKLITLCKQLADAPAEGYGLNVEILSSGIQAEGVDKLGNKPIELAWNVDFEDGEIIAATIATE